MRLRRAGRTPAVATSFDRHSERSEESLRGCESKQGEIPRHAACFGSLKTFSVNGMGMLLLFPLVIPFGAEFS